MVVSPHTSLAEIAKKAAFYVDPALPESIAQGIEKYLELNQRGKDNLVKLGLETAQEFTWEKTVNQTYACYEEIINA